MDEPHRVTLYIACLHILATTPLDDDDRVGVTVIWHAMNGGAARPGLPAVLDCSAMLLDKP